MFWITLFVPALVAAHHLHHDDPREYPHDRIESIEQDASEIQLLLEPAIKIGTRACNPFPAVDVDGNWSGGLRATGPKDGDCTVADGQMYVRNETYAHGAATMYSFFTPKQHGQRKTHRYDWQWLVMFTSPHTVSDAYTPVWKICYWQVFEDKPDKLLCKSRPEYVRFHNKHHIGIRYHHGAGDTATRIDPYEDDDADEDGTILVLDLIAWDRLPPAARKTFNDDPFQATSPVPFNDANFQRNVNEAYTAGLN